MDISGEHQNGKLAPLDLPSTTASQPTATRPPAIPNHLPPTGPS